MKITSVTVEGGSGNGRSCTISRDGNQLVFSSLHFETVRLNTRESSDKVWWAAQSLQFNLDGKLGAGGDVREYSQLILSMMD